MLLHSVLRLPLCNLLLADGSGLLLAFESPSGHWFIEGLTQLGVTIPLSSLTHDTEPSLAPPMASTLAARLAPTTRRLLFP